MKRFIQFIALVALVSFMAPIVSEAQQSANRDRAQQTIQANLPEGVTLENATLEQIEAAIEALAATLSDDDYAELSGEMAAIFAESRPELAASCAAAIVRSAPAARVASVSVSVAANAAASSAGRSGASSASQIAQQVSAAAAPRGGVPTQALAQAIVNSVPSAAAEISQSLNVQVTAPANPIAPPSGTAPVAPTPGTPTTPVVSVPIPGEVQDEAPDVVDVPVDPEDPSPMAN
ncbi:MAG: hypothetical protein JJU20_07440 [Opitutales bacterium]|nr:hypothetical protein [Opitutales bacterium]